MSIYVYADALGVAAPMYSWTVLMTPVAFLAVCETYAFNYEKANIGYSNTKVYMKSGEVWDHPVAHLLRIQSEYTLKVG